MAPTSKSPPAARRPAASRSATRPIAVPDAEVPVVGQREPCPCGSGKKYKGCHGRARAQQRDAFVARPFAGLAGETDWVALREIVPAATATVRLAVGEADAETGIERVTVATVLPLAWPALRRADGQVFVGLQTGGGSGDASRDLGSALQAALSVEPGTPVTLADLVPGPRLQDLLNPEVPLDVVVHQGFDFWVEGTEERAPAVQESLERANAAVIPTERLTGVQSAYWCRVGDRAHLRWVLPQPEDELLDALARLHAGARSSLGEGTKYVGAFRAHGLLVPVWDLPLEWTAADVEAPAAVFSELLQEALSLDAPLTHDERRARAGVVSRQLTLR